MKRSITNNTNIKYVNNLYVNAYPRKTDSGIHVVQNALNIYKESNDYKNVDTINAILKLCFKYKCSDKVLSIWNDIEKLHRSMDQNNCLLSYSFLMKCCINSDLINSDKCIKVIQWIKNCNYKLKIHPVYMNKLLTKSLKGNNNTYYNSKQGTTSG
eukprot:79063_1